MKNNNKKQGIVANFFWKFAERVGAQFVTLVVSIVLARILSPEHYGTISIILVCINLADVFIASGFTAALVQKKDSDDLDFSTIFYFNLLFSLVLYGILFVCAPFVERYFGLPDLALAIQILGLKIPVSAFNSIQQAYVAKKMIFRKLFWATFGGTVASAVVGIWMACNGYGVFALVGQYLTNGIIGTLMLWFVIGWRPILKFSFFRFKGLYSYGWRNLVTHLVRTLYDDIYSLVIGKKYSSADLAFYTKGKQYPNLIVHNLNTALCSVLFPAFVQYQDDIPKLKLSLQRAIRLGSYILSPFLVGLAVCAEPFVKLLLTEKWLECVPYLQIVCLYQLLIPMSSSNLQVVKSLGRGDILLKLEITKRVVGILILLVSMQFGVLAVAIGAALATFFNSCADVAATKKLVNYSYREQILDILGSVSLAFIMGILVYGFKFLIKNAALLLVVQVLVGAVVFVFLSYITKNESFLYVLGVVKEKLHINKKV